MCLAVPAKVIQRDGADGVVDLGGNRLNIRMALTPDAVANDWVLVHAGFAIARIEEADALETWACLKACYDGDMSGV
ncbi:MAG: HypC/HybG/HupF family hydrogenase formation chaperone, partial [Planctomycetales bacterium]|nr:HypC/HybG/HupF family hydrogenase formation chaperone [Planctomycetales bacterium]